MTRSEIDIACGQTPCLCGDIETWHPSCYPGKTASQVKGAYALAYRRARVQLEQRAQQQIARMLYSSRHEDSSEALAASAIAKARRTRI